MKQLTKIFLGIVITLIGLEASAQPLIIKAGPNFSNMLFKDEDDTYSGDYSFNPGFHVGALVELPVADGLSIETGIVVDTKGFRIVEEDKSLNYKITGSANLIFIDIPITAKLSTEINDNMNVFGNFGPFVGAGIAGQTKTVSNFDGDKDTDTDNIEWGSDEFEDDLKRLDYGLTIGAGMEINSIILGVFFDLGLGNISAYTDENTQVKTKVFKVSVGYKIGAE